jgi:hypothetical protein
MKRLTIPVHCIGTKESEDAKDNTKRNQGTGKPDEDEFVDRINLEAA